jgi:ribose transport system substrate-binding protein
MPAPCSVGESYQDCYLSGTVLRACNVLGAFGLEGEALRLKDLVSRTGLNKATVFRLLHSLEKGGLIERTASGQYRATIKPIRRSRIRLGYASNTRDNTFSREVASSFLQAAEEEGIDILVLDNQASPRVSLYNADKLIKARVDLAIEHQQHEQIAPRISEKFQQAQIPLIAVSFPHPGAVYFGANNYEAGLIGGRGLGQWAMRHFEGEADEIILLGRPSSGPWLQARLRGVEAGLREVLPKVGEAKVVHLAGGEYSQSLEAVRKHLRYDRASRILVGAINDASALGALCAFHEAGRLAECGVVGQGASTDARAELRNPRTRFIGSVAYFPDRYGQGLIALALKILARRRLPPAVFIHHRLITPQNVDELYSSDLLALCIP